MLITSSENDLPTAAIQQIEVDLDSFPGDRHYGYKTISGGREKPFYQRGTPISNLRQWSAVSREELEIVRNAMGLPELLPDWIGANLLFSGIDSFTQLPSLSRLRSKENNGATLIVYEETNPCRFPQKYIDRGAGVESKMAFEKAARGMRGLVGWVESPGILSAGTEMEVWIPKK